MHEVHAQGMLVAIGLLAAGVGILLGQMLVAIFGVCFTISPLIRLVVIASER